MSARVRFKEYVSQATDRFQGANTIVDAVIAVVCIDP
jgi:hypothetical protein